MATVYRRQATTALLIFSDLKANGPSYWWQVGSRCNMTYSQFRYGLDYLKDHMQRANGQPLITQDGWDVYSLTDKHADWWDYIHLYRLRSIHTQLLRLEETADAGGIKFGMSKASTRKTIAGVKAARLAVEAVL